MPNCRHGDQAGSRAAADSHQTARQPADEGNELPTQRRLTITSMLFLRSPPAGLNWATTRTSQPAVSRCTSVNVRGLILVLSCHTVNPQSVCFFKQR
ncbi:hypothetical protein INR49_017939 [Caranx melampygus]|nr:hypothetical protein INR49_017939 [Caranx melampygus]